MSVGVTSLVRQFTSHRGTIVSSGSKKQGPNLYLSKQMQIHIHGG